LRVNRCAYPTLGSGSKVSPLRAIRGYAEIFISTLLFPVISLDRVLGTLPKFMQTLNDHMYRELEKVAKKRGVTVQELIRAVVLPEWMAKQEEGRERNSS